eukprot:scaffold101032_cov28-Tisochrysis_lutea.AAC.2
MARSPQGVEGGYSMARPASLALRGAHHRLHRSLHGYGHQRSPDQCDLTHREDDVCLESEDIGAEADVFR